MSLLSQSSDAMMELQKAYSVLSIEYNQAMHRIQGLEEEILRLKEQLLLMQQKQFGKKSEAQVGEPIVNTPELQVVAGYTRKKGKKTCGRTIDTTVLPRYRLFHNLEETHCSCGCTLKKIGEDISEQLEVLPMRLYVIEHIRAKYTCTKCSTIKMAPKPKSPIPKALAGASLLTEIILNKYQYHLPLYRQSKILESYNAYIPDNTLGNWIIHSGNDLVPLYDAFWEVILESRYLQVDETPIKILKPEKKGYLWTYYAPHIGTGLVVFELSLTRSGQVAEERLTSFKGLLQTDGYAGYQNLRERRDITGFGCITHARRKFDEVLKITKNSEGLAAYVIEQLKPLYALEERMKRTKVTFHTRKRLRQKYAWPLLKTLHRWLKEHLPKVPPKSKLGEAFHYTLKQWPYLIAYLRHGSVEIDTNFVENKIRPIAIGKKNWLFMGNEDSGKIHAFWYTLVLSAMMNGLNPRLYVHYILTMLHDIRMKKIDPKLLLPHTIEHAQLQAFADEQLAFSKQVLNSS